MIPNATLWAWFKAFREKHALESLGDSESIPNSSESISEARIRLAAIDPDSPLTKIKRALWDVVDRPDQDGAGVKVQALRELFKMVQWEHNVISAQDENDVDVTELSEAELKKLARGG